MIEACSAARRVRSMASATIWSTSTSAAPGIGSAPCTRDSSISSPTSLASRGPSCWMRAAKRATICGSSAASWIASASRVSAPTGVLSSCETLATKSRRTASSRRCSLRSDSSRQTPLARSSQVGAQRHGGRRTARSARGPSRPIGRSTCRCQVVAGLERATGRARRGPGRPAGRRRATPIARAAGLTRTARSSRSTTTTPWSSASTTSEARCGVPAARAVIGRGRNGKAGPRTGVVTGDRGADARPNPRAIPATQASTAAATTIHSTQ